MSDTKEPLTSDQQHADIIHTLEMAGVPVRPDDLARGGRPLHSLWYTANRNADYYRERSLPRPHQEPADCPTYYDGCNCTVECLEHNIERAEKAEAEVKALEAETAQYDKMRQALCDHFNRKLKAQALQIEKLRQTVSEYQSALQMQNRAAHQDRDARGVVQPLSKPVDDLNGKLDQLIEKLDI